MARRTRAAGVTLIELLTVVTIMMVVLGLVGSSTIESVSKAKAQSELIAVQSLIKKASVMAFSTGAGLELTFEASTVTVSVTDEFISLKRFEYLRFDSQHIVFNRNGIASSQEIKVNLRGIETILDLAPLLDNFAP